MTLSVVLRLIPSEILEGRIVGEAELVETGHRRVVRNADELIEFLNDPPTDGEPGRGKASR